MLNNTTWKDKFQSEIDHAESARALGNEGKSRVCARRAAGIVAYQYLSQAGLTPASSSAVVNLKFLYSHPGLPEPVREIISHFLQHVSEDFRLPEGVDLIMDARQLADELL